MYKRFDKRLKKYMKKFNDFMKGINGRKQNEWEEQ